MYTVVHLFWGVEGIQRTNAFNINLYVQLCIYFHYQTLSQFTISLLCRLTTQSLTDATVGHKSERKVLSRLRYKGFLTRQLVGDLIYGLIPFYSPG